MYITIHPQIRYRVTDNLLYEYSVFKRPFIFFGERKWMVCCTMVERSLGELFALMELGLAA